MNLLNRIRSIFRRSDDPAPLPFSFDSEILGQVVVRATSEEQRNKVLRAAFQLSEMWKDTEQSYLPRVMVMIEATYPYLERLADSEPNSTEWMSALAEALRVTTDSAEDLTREQEEVNEKLREALGRNKAD